MAIKQFGILGYWNYR